ncbi:MAG: methylmalonyl-CoA epimerase [Dehalococcoidia bacterium]|nr:methylmalonyl-CoA epimerase [Dehalococcoidia bacterium]MDW8119671.1 methylmalonyl-CoA epimerase [Chloroflexota bacterium]
MTTPCVARSLDHIAIATPDIYAALRFYQQVFGLPTTVTVEEVPDQKVLGCLIPLQGGTRLELIQPTDPHTGVGRFVAQRGEALHHIAFVVDDLSGALQRLAAQGLTLIDTEPRHGLAGRIAFLHPKSTRGVLIELVQQG